MHRIIKMGKFAYGICGWNKEHSLLLDWAGLGMLLSYMLKNVNFQLCVHQLGKLIFHLAQLAYSDWVAQSHFNSPESLHYQYAYKCLNILKPTMQQTNRCLICNTFTTFKRITPTLWRVYTVKNQHIQIEY